MLMSKSSAPVGPPAHPSLDTAYAKSRATGAVVSDLNRAEGRLMLHVCRLNHDVILIMLKPPPSPAPVSS